MFMNLHEHVSVMAVYWQHTFHLSANGRTLYCAMRVADVTVDNSKRKALVCDK